MTVMLNSPSRPFPITPIHPNGTTNTVHENAVITNDGDDRNETVKKSRKAKITQIAPNNGVPLQLRQFENGIAQQSRTPQHLNLDDIFNQSSQDPLFPQFAMSYQSTGRNGEPIQKDLRGLSDYRLYRELKVFFKRTLKDMFACAEEMNNAFKNDDAKKGSLQIKNPKWKAYLDFAGRFLSGLLGASSIPGAGLIGGAIKWTAQAVGNHAVKGRQQEVFDVFKKIGEFWSSFGQSKQKEMISKLAKALAVDGMSRAMALYGTGGESNLPQTRDSYANNTVLQPGRLSPDSIHYNGFGFNPRDKAFKKMYKEFTDVQKNMVGDSVMPPVYSQSLYGETKYFMDNHDGYVPLSRVIGAEAFGPFFGAVIAPLAAKDATDMPFDQDSKQDAMNELFNATKQYLANTVPQRAANLEKVMLLTDPKTRSERVCVKDRSRSMSRKLVAVSSDSFMQSPYKTDNIPTVDAGA